MHPVFSYLLSLLEASYVLYGVIGLLLTARLTLFQGDLRQWSMFVNKETDPQKQ